MTVFPIETVVFYQTFSMHQILDECDRYVIYDIFLSFDLHAVEVIHK